MRKKCATPYCKNRIMIRNYCRSCQAKKWREANTMRYVYNVLKQNCKRRHGLGWFELSFEEFELYAIETDYLAGRGRKKQSWSIDRKDNTMGYFLGNICIRTTEFNSRKRTKILNYDWENKHADVTDKKPQQIENSPF